MTSPLRKSPLRWKRHRLDGRRAWQLENGRLRVELLEGGGHVASLALLGTEAPAGINPLWTPPWPSMEPYRFSMAEHGRAYGSNSESRLLSGIRGHNVCFDYWGAPSPDELKGGLSFHGEAGVIRWRLRDARVKKNELMFSCEADMRLSAAHFLRTVRMRAGEPVAYLEECARNLTALDRQIGWVEHVTIGPPFLRRGETLLDLPATHGASLPGTLGRVPPETEFEWPFVEVGQASRPAEIAPPSPPFADSTPSGRAGLEACPTSVDLRIAAPERRSGFDLAVLIDPGRELGYIAAATPRARLLVAYVFRRADFPWVNLWEQNRMATIAPWRGRALSVGLEFANTVVPGSRRAMAAAAPERYGVPTYGWLPALGSRTVRYLALLAEIPRDFHGVADIQPVAGGMCIFERETPREINISCNAEFLRG